MIEKDQQFFINNPVFVKFKDRFELKYMERVRRLKSVHVNERVIEIPFAIVSVSDLNGQGKILDLGCTESVIPMHMASLGFEVTGLDFRKYPYQHPNINSVQGDILKMPFEDENFDAVFCISTLEHIGLGYYSDPTQDKAPDEQGVSEIHRVLKSKGTFVLTVPFGVAHVTKQQRFYDYPSVERLLTKYSLEQVRFFAIQKNDTAPNNYWKEISKDEASRIKSEENAQCVCLIKAKKN